MAAVADAFASKLMGILQDMAKEEVEMRLGVPGEITKLETTLRNLSLFLADAERKRIRDSAADWLMREVTDIMYGADDILDICQILESGEDPMVAEGPAPWRRKIPLLSCFSNQVVSHQIGFKIKVLNERLEDLAKRSSRFGFIRQAIGGSTARSDFRWKSTPICFEPDIVGEKIDEDRRKLCDLLVNEMDAPTRSVVVVAITGAAGIGKTTLAQMVFNDRIVQEHFEVKIWLSVNQEVDGIHLLRQSIAYVGGETDGVEDTIGELGQRLHLAMREKKFLVVMDDVWSGEAWHILELPLTGGAPGSRVLVTTRNDKVARDMEAQHLHRVTTLDPDDSWLLLKKQVSPAADDRDIDDLKDIGMMIIEKCDGLPLAIKVIGGLLSTRAPERDSWFYVLNHNSDEQLEIISSSLYLSYQDLSPQLKQCFLYYSLLPKGVNFDSPNVINMWISEGFIHRAASGADELEDTGTECHQDLIMRHLVEPGASCSMHDIVRSFAQHMAREEALVVQMELKTGVRSHLLSKLRRLSIESTESVPVEWADLQKLVLLRVLIINGTVNFKPGDSLSSFSSLRVLHAVRVAGSDMLVSSLCQLKHLRYLYLYDSDISRLPDDIDRMKFLQHIGIVNCGSFVRLPVNIINLRQLRSLDLVGSSVDAIPRGFSGLTNLRSLLGFPVHIDGGGQGWCSLEELGPLRQLRHLRLEGIEKVNASYLADRANISSMGHLISLHLNCSKSISANVTNSEQQLIQEVYEHLCPPRCVENLVMETYIGRRLPSWMWAPEAAAFGSLRYMVLRNLASCTELPDGLCQIPCLERLEINKAPLVKHVGPEFLEINKAPVAKHLGTERAFPRLQELVLHGMVKWCGWVWDPLKAAMPALQVLLVEHCRLRSFPPGLYYHARALRHLVIAHARRLESLEAFSSLVELDICLSPRLRKIANLPKLQKLTIKICPKLSVLEGVPALRSLVLEDYTMKTLPGYLLLQDDVCPKKLTLDCTLKLLKSISMGKGGSEWPKISHIQQVAAYAEDGGHQRKWSVLYTREPFSFEAYMPYSEENLADDKLVRSDDIPSDGSTDSQTDDELDDNNDSPTGSTGVDLFNNDSELVGIESPREKIIEMLMHGRHPDKQQLQVVSIYGIGGLGKTTIAKSVYRRISNRFECCAYVSVSQIPDIVGIMKSIIDQVRCPYSSMEEVSNPQDNLQVIISILEKFLEDKRYLIVIDDIWEASVWETIKTAFIGNYQGSGIIATTCKVDVAESIGGIYTPPLLSDEDSKILFYRRTNFRSEAGCPSQYREVSKRLLNKCSRLPLAIITITSLLRPLNSEEEWKKVCNSIDSGFELGDIVTDMRRILSRSYHDLSPHLRKCFLYLSIFPEDYVIRRDSLVQRWLSEGLIPSDHGQNLHELGETYFYQLLDTGMIQPVEFDNDGNALACRVPVVIIDLIAYLLLIEEKHNTTSASQRRTDPPNMVERLSLQVSKEEKDAVAKATKSLGTAAGTISSSAKETTKCFWEGSLSISCSADSVDALPISKNLRVLVLEGSLENRHVDKYLGRSSRQLRYLILASTQITEIPKKVGNLQFLQTLDLRETRVTELPRTFVRLKQLQCLLINRSTKVPAGISNLQALKELQDIDISKSPDILEGICTLPELRVLKIALWSWDESSSKLLPETLCKLRTNELKHLSISTCCSLEFKSNDDVEVFQNITKLEIRHSTFNTLPTWIDKLKKLSSLSIEVYLLEEDALRILGGLPALVFLSLTAKKTPEAGPAEDKVVVRSNGFGCLKTFHLFSRAMVIKFEKGSMKSLERLKLSFQASLTKEDFSFGLGNLSSLKHIQVELICFSATEKAVKKAEDAIRGMIWASSRQPRPALDIRRSAEEYKIDDKKELREEARDGFLAYWDGRTASV